jgi:hypothetical protein
MKREKLEFKFSFIIVDEKVELTGLFVPTDNGNIHIVHGRFDD